MSKNFLQKNFRKRKVQTLSALLEDGGQDLLEPVD